MKTLLGGGFQFDKVTSELHPKKVNTLTLDKFKTLVFRLSQTGDPMASAFVEAMLLEGIERRFDTAAGIKVEETERNRRLYERMMSKREFGSLTDQLKRHGFTKPSQYRKFVWQFQTIVGIESGARDISDAETLARLNAVQVRLTTLMECGVSPWDALKRL